MIFCVTVLSVVPGTLYCTAYKDNELSSRDATSHLVHVERNAEQVPRKRLVRTVLEFAALLNLPALALNNPRSTRTSKFLGYCPFVLILININSLLICSCQFNREQIRSRIDSRCKKPVWVLIVSRSNFPVVP